MQPISDFITTYGIKIHYKRLGIGKPPMVFCHGITDNCDGMLRLAEHVVPSYDAILIDARGHGLSDKPEHGYTADHHAEDIHAIVTALGLEKPILYGHSMGARTVTRFAAKYPHILRAAILEDPVGIIPMTKEETIEHDQWAEQMPDMIRHWKTLTETELLQMAVEANHPDWTEAEKLEWARAKSQVDPKVMGISNSMFTILQDFPKITCPVLILKADADEEIRQKNEAAVANISLGKIIHVDWTGHDVRRDNWKDTIHHIDEFLKTLS